MERTRTFIHKPMKKRYEHIFSTDSLGPDDETLTRRTLLACIFSLTFGPAMIVFTLWASTYKHEISLWFGKLLFL